MLVPMWAIQEHLMTIEAQRGLGPVAGADVLVAGAVHAAAAAVAVAVAEYSAVAAKVVVAVVAVAVVAVAVVAVVVVVAVTVVREHAVPALGPGHATAVAAYVEHRLLKHCSWIERL